MIPNLGLGTATLSGDSLAEGLYGGSAEKEAISILNESYKKGFRYIDTAPLYGTGKAEERIGKSIFSKIDKSKFIISSKVGRLVRNNPNVTSDELSCIDDWSEKAIYDSIEESLKRLSMNSIDIVYVHDPDTRDFGENQAIKYAFPTLIKLREQGIIKAIGCGMNEWEMPKKFIEKFDLDIILLAGRYTLLEQTSLGFLSDCIKYNTKIVIGGPYNSGILARDLNGPVSYDYEPAPENLIQKAKKINNVCKNNSIPMKAAALQFALHHPAIISVIPGVQSLSELLENINMIKFDIPNRFWDELKNEKLISFDSPINLVY
ncbi:MAG: aldo/keto reductase [Dehalococcoidia bacterium]